jgi:hypothetical protein
MLKYSSLTALQQKTALPDSITTKQGLPVLETGPVFENTFWYYKKPKNQGIYLRGFPFFME